MMIELGVQSCGMLTSAGLSAPASCAAIRCGLTNVAETHFLNRQGQFFTGCEVPLDGNYRGLPKLARMAAMAIKECMEFFDNPEEGLEKIPVFLCLAEADRPGRLQDQDEYLLNDIGEFLGVTLNNQSRIIAKGRAGGVQAIEAAQNCLSNGSYRHCLVAGTDILVRQPTLSLYEQTNRILTEENSDGFIPGEAGAAVLLCPLSRSRNAAISIKGIGFGNETATILSGLPLRAEAMVQAVKNALSMAGMDMADMDYRICDANGEQYGFKEATLTRSRILRKLKDEFDIWHPAECIGETGAAIVPIILGVASAAVQKNYSPGPGILCHVGNDDGLRAAMVLKSLI
ncbi:MAG: hypothetical protein GY874_22535 [Desulfobacteraceae bacterium]|nr:hypothetical protein [Desulfobacteraceae bacterium]